MHVLTILTAVRTKPVRLNIYRHITRILVLAVCVTAGAKAAEKPDGRSAFNGQWIVNEELSDDTDTQVEKAIRAAGGKIDRGGRRGNEKYRGGPEEHELYDHISYDRKLIFQYRKPEFHLVYEQGFERIFHSDNRKRIVSASGQAAGDAKDFSFASWDGDRLIVESRPRDGGWIFETYEYEQETDQLKVSLELKPSSFAEPIRIMRIYDRLHGQDTGE